MCYESKNLSEKEYNAFRQLLLTLEIEWKDCKGQDIITIIKKRYYSLSLKFHPDKNVGVTEDQKNHDEEKIREINHANKLLQEFIVEPLQKGLSKRNNLVKELRSKLYGYSLEELEGYLDDNGRKKFSNKQESIVRNVVVLLVLNVLGQGLGFCALIAFFITNGIFCNVPLAVGAFAPVLTLRIINSALGDVYHKNGKELNIGNMLKLLFDFDQECKDFSESDGTKLKWLKNSLILSNVICTSLVFYGVGLDIVANGFGVTHSVLLSGLLLTLPYMLLTAAISILDTDALKYTIINIIEEQFKGDGKYNEKPSPSSDINTDGAFPHNLDYKVVG